MANCSGSIRNPCPQYPRTNCVIYNGPTLSNINVHNGDNLTSILQKINQYISGGSSAPNLAIKSSDFESDGKTYINSILAGLNYSIFSNETSRFLYESSDGAIEGVEFIRLPGGGFEILTSAIDTNLYNYHFKIIITQ